jgi:hypothetical protein
MKQMKTRAMSSLARLAGAVVPAYVLLCAGLGAGSPSGARAAPAMAAPGPIGSGVQLQAPLSFEPNLGADKAGDSFLARTPGYSALIAPTSLQLPAVLGSTGIRLSYLDANPRARLTPEGRLPGVVNYFLGQDPRLRQMGIPTYARLREHDLYPGIDLVYYFGRHGLEYDLRVRPGADTRRIRIATTGLTPRIQGGDGFLTELNFRGTSVYSSTMLGGVVPAALALGPNGHPSLTGSATRQDSQNLRG